MIPILNFLRNHHTVYQRGYTILHPILQWMRFPISPHFHNTCYLPIFKKLFYLYCHTKRYEVLSHCGFDFISLMTNDDEQTHFYVFLGYFYVFLGEIFWYFENIRYYLNILFCKIIRMPYDLEIFRNKIWTIWTLILSQLDYNLEEKKAFNAQTLKKKLR